MNKETKLILEALEVLLVESMDKENVETDLGSECWDEKKKLRNKINETLNPKTESAELNKERDVLMKNKEEKSQ